MHEKEKTFKAYLDTVLNESSKKKNLEEVGQIIASEGLGYAIESYLGWKDIEDKQLAKYWKQAEDAIDKIHTITDKYNPEI